jgi:hypothetical protein
MPQIFGITRRAQPTKTADGTQQQFRVSAYGEQPVVPYSAGTYALCDEGSYFKATNPTMGTAITHATTATWSATAALAILRNTDAEGGKRIYLDYIDLLVVGTPATATSADLSITIDNTNRFSSGGTAITPQNSNMDSAQATIASLNFGAVIATAASGSVRTVTRQRIKTQAAPCLTAGDSVLMNFGVVETVGGPISGTVANILPVSTGPVIIGGGDSLLVHVWYPAVTAAPTYEFEMGWWER